ncbi:S-layer homology domain-containing protein [Petrocella sp. FN5]|uniref:S-layer homology domain-containing protein n=1 Tax=Petrocella sp. FN5 TaxID=3032002 RepID=UPI0023DBF31D|nr:S-layer homology domain-containing protein [Petrocella sp. FN5]MDF1616968.1 S-layer homology domain-containing protein [Petrocella sp. FN5]
MLNKTKKGMSVLLALVIVLSQMTMVTAATSDYQDHWAHTNIEKWMEMGIVNGYPSGEFKPEAPITRAEFVTVINNIFQLEEKTDATFTDVKATDWFEDAVIMAFTAGIVQGHNNQFKPDDRITRQEAAIVLTNAFQLIGTDAYAYSTYADAADVATWAATQMSVLVEKGYMQGRSNNVLAPMSNLTRAEAVTLLSNIAGELITEPGTVTDMTYEGNLVISSTGVVLKDTIIKGNLYITQGVADGEVDLDNVKVLGELVAFGGGENTITLTNTEVGTLRVIKHNGKIRILAIGNTKVDQVDMYSGGKLEEDGTLTGKGFGNVEIYTVRPGETLTLEGDFDKVTLNTPVKNMVISEGSIGTLDIKKNAEGSEINIDSTGKVGTLILSGSTTVTGTGTIDKAVVEANGSTMTMTPTETTVSKDVEVEIGDKTVTEDDNTEEPTSGGGGGGGGSTPTPTTTLTFEMSIGADEKVITISAATNASYTEILRQVLNASYNEFDTTYDAYIANVEAHEGSFLIDSLTLFLYADQADLSGTIYSAVPLSAGATWTELEKKTTLKEALRITRDNYNNLETVQADLTTIAERVDFRTIEYDGQQYKSVVIKDSQDNIVASYTQDEGDKAAYINALFNELKALTMSSDVSYTVTTTLADNTQRIATFGAN